MKKIAVGITVALATSSLGSFAAMGAETTVTAIAESPAGTRVLQPLVAPAALLFINSRTASSPFTASVVETLANGVNPWYVTVKAGDFTGPGGTISASALSYAGGEAAVTLPGDLSGTIEAGTDGSLNGAGQRMFTVTGEVPGAFPGYTGTYTGAGSLSLTLPAGVAAGTYTATITVTMVA